MTPSPAELSDETLMLAFSAGDFAAFELLYTRHKNAVYRMTLRQCRHAGVAEELCQEIWMKIIAAAESYVVSARFTTWLYRIVQNRVIDYLRSHGKLAGIEQSLEEDETGEALQVAAAATWQPEVHALRRENAACLIDAIEALPGPQREAVLLHFEGELTLEEIAHLTETSRETVKSRLRYGVRKIRESLLGLATAGEAPA
ncbi:sigma-70 family RNA polymerase sigma factor [Uliginosibacterium sp. 31-16]|uniref:sigma-70 family RNA polymerase sigma factor n=1 Tax=Uliginosibacterium sp. 31-16 TaxID=3068315 RepID=UPI00273D2900|nr:sigma-70 family RNA polymerase sigma factor [Uliginosibacterium sp. 31-16]MDP5238422.1 sigma-70 family RNA polymerase sigma factor [Uliginosibacterium sp. 31-16]